MKKINNKIIYTFVLVTLSVPSFVQAVWTTGQPLVPCGRTGQAACNFNGLVQLASNIIDFIIYMSVSVSAIMFAYAGFLYITAQGETGKISTAHSIFKNVGLGLVFVLGAWLIVKAVLTGLGGTANNLLGL